MRTYIVYLTSLMDGCTCYFTCNTKQPIKKTQTKAPTNTHTHSIKDQPTGRTTEAKTTARTILTLTWCKSIHSFAPNR